MKPSDPPTPLLELREITLAYDDKIILDKIDLQINVGEFVCLVGKSGIGKSTLLYTLGGFLRPLSGFYRFEGKRVFRLGEIGLGRFRKKNIGYLFQDFRLLPFLTIEQNISFPTFFTGEKFSKEELHALMEDLGIFHRRKAYPRDISGGEAQRTALARALLMRPKALLLDEPTGNLDSETEQEILQLLLKLHGQKLTLICVTHSRNLIEAADRVIRLENRSLIEITQKPTSQKPAPESGPKPPGKRVAPRKKSDETANRPASKRASAATTKKKNPSTGVEKRDEATKSSEKSDKMASRRKSRSGEKK